MKKVTTYYEAKSDEEITLALGKRLNPEAYPWEDAEGLINFFLTPNSNLSQSGSQSDRERQASDADVEKLVAYTNAFMKAGGTHIQYNIVDSEDLKAAKKTQAERDRLQRRQKEIQDTLGLLAEQIENLRQEETRQHAARAASDSAMETLKRNLSFGSAEEAELQIRKWTKKQQELTAKVEAHDRAVRSAKQVYDTVRGSLEGKEKEIPGLKEELPFPF